MKLFPTTVALLATVALANVLEERALSETCYTVFGPTLVKSVPTISSTSTLTFLSTKTNFVHPTITVTPPAVTSTWTEKDTVVVVTTVTAVTDTATVTNTITSTETDAAPTTILTTTSTAFVEASTTITTTTTVGTYAAFTPVQTSLPNSSNVQKRAWIERLKARGLRSKPMPRHIVPDTGYPERVNCEVSKTVTKVKTAIYTGGSKVTKSASKPTVIKTKTVTVTSRSSIFPPDVTTTVTSTHTNTAFTTTTPSTTVTTSTTVTDTATQTATATFLAQCAANNYAAESPNGVLTNVAGLGTAQLVESTLTNAYDCCAACVANPECSAGIFSRGQNPDNCYLLLETFCVPQSPLHGYSVTEQTGLEPTLQFFNGNCGEFTA